MDQVINDYRLMKGKNCLFGHTLNRRTVVNLTGAYTVGMDGSAGRAVRNAVGFIGLAK